jgi:hypothetical protein
MNHVLLAFGEPKSLAEIQAALAAAPAQVAEIATDVSREIRPYSPGPGALVLTDDKAPIEALTRRMMRTARGPGALPPR